MRSIEEVIRELSGLQGEFRLKAYESGSFTEEDRYTEDADVIADAMEYLWQYQGLME